MRRFLGVANKFSIARSYLSNCRFISLIAVIGQVKAHKFVKKLPEVQAFSSIADGTFSVN
jgi:hypothetical protein